MTTDDAPAPEEPLTTTAEKEAWLRERGVEIESAADRASKAAARNQKKPATTTTIDGASSASAHTRAFTYVLIPADDAKPFEERVAIVDADAPPSDALVEILRPVFAGGGGIVARAAREQAVRQFGEKGAAVTAAALENVAADGATETFALVRPSDANGERGVSLYLDEVGLLKGSPHNARASALARACGYDDVDIRGDVFAGAIGITRDGERVSADFRVSELDGDAAWLKAAKAENYEHGMKMKKFQESLGDRAGGLVSGGIDMTGGGGNGGGMPGGPGVDMNGNAFAWCQTDDEVEIMVDVDADIVAKDVVVTFRPDGFAVRARDEVMLAVPSLFRKTRPDECTWTLERGGGGEGGEGEGARGRVVATLAKMDEEVWDALKSV